MSSNSDFETKWRHTWKWKQVFICNLSKGTKRIHSRTELCTVKKENVGEPDIVIFKTPLEPPPPGTPMRPQVCLIYSGDLYQYHRPKDFFKSNFEGKSNVPLSVLKPVKTHKGPQTPRNFNHCNFGYYVHRWHCP